VCILVSIDIDIDIDTNVYVYTCILCKDIYICMSHLILHYGVAVECVVVVHGGRRGAHALEDAEEKDGVAKGREARARDG